MRESDKQQIRQVIAEELRGQVEAGLRQELAEKDLEIAGLRRSLEATMKGTDGLMPVSRTEVKRSTELTEQGVRQQALASAARTYEVVARTNEVGSCVFTDDDVLKTARKYETYLLGGFINGELPTSTETEQS